MSGGSFNYICFKDFDELCNNTSDLDDMVTALVGYGAEDAAKESEEIKILINQCRVRIEARLDRLQPVWKAMEWWKSCDTSEESFEKALKKYRGEDEPK